MNRNGDYHKLSFGRFLKTIFLVEILQGMWLTLRHLFTPAVTQQYPEVKPQLAPGFRGFHALMRDENGKEKFIACCLCEGACPTNVITIYSEERQNQEKVPVVYDMNMLRCIFCGLCVEVCPVEAIVMTPYFEFANYSREDFILDKKKLLALGDRAVAEGVEVYKTSVY
ncbi:MAG: NADH-quinone oxidoreductase subunit NuoI [Nitrospirae bacterium]|nr:NADH-quinone oxidoreductase subunit NuoI [Nitrospirota bacterium]